MAISVLAELGRFSSPTQMHTVQADTLPHPAPFPHYSGVQDVTARFPEPPIQELALKICVTISSGEGAEVRCGP